MVEESVSTPKWNAKVSTVLHKATADQIWPLLLDFFNLHKWFPTLTTCRGVLGANGVPGGVRYCEGFSLSTSSGAGDSDNGTSKSDVRSVMWSKERLVSVDHVWRTLCYEMVDSSLGFESYMSTIGVVPEGDVGCVMEWEFTVDPVEGWELEDLVRKYEAGLKGMGERMEHHVLGIH